MTLCNWAAEKSQLANEKPLLRRISPVKLDKTNNYSVSQLFGVPILMYNTDQWSPIELYSDKSVATTRALRFKYPSDGGVV